MHRRTFLAGLGGGLAAAQGTAAQLAAMAAPRLGFLGNADSKTEGALLNGFREALKDFGLIEGRTITIEYRWAEGNVDRFPSLAADLVRLGCNVIGASGVSAVRAAQRATNTIPIVILALLVTR